MLPDEQKLYDIEMKVGLFPGFSLLTLNKSQTPVFGFSWEL